MCLAICVRVCAWREAIFCASLNVRLLPFPTRTHPRPSSPLRRSRPQPLARQPLRLPCFDRCSLCPNASRRTLWRLSHPPHTHPYSPSLLFFFSSPLHSLYFPRVPSLFHVFFPSPSSSPDQPSFCTRLNSTFSPYSNFLSSGRRHRTADVVPGGLSEPLGSPSFGPSCGPLQTAARRCHKRRREEVASPLSLG